LNVVATSSWRNNRGAFTSAATDYTPSIAMNDVANVACCFDSNMELSFLVLANSIKRQLKDGRRVVLHAFHSNPLMYPAEYRTKLRSNASFEIRFHPVENPYREIDSSRYFTRAICMRLMLPALLKDVDRVVYLDCDVIAAKDVTELHDIDLHGFAIGAVLEYRLLSRFGTIPSGISVKRYLKELVQLTDPTKYFNSGVLVMDLKQFRDKGLVRVADEFIARTKGQKFFDDQDTLNYVVDGRFLELDPRWNAFGGILCHEAFLETDPDFAATIALCHSDPWLVHYSGRDKPWKGTSPRNKMDDYFWREAMECEALPLLVGAYLDFCSRIGLSKFAPESILVARGKPALDRAALELHARQFAGNVVVARATSKLIDRLERRTPKRQGQSVLVSSEQFYNKGGVPHQGKLIFDLANAAGRIVFGPYLWYPPRAYNAVFDICVASVITDERGGLVIEVVCNYGHRFLAQRVIPDTGKITVKQCTLAFEVDDTVQDVEFRIFVEGFTSGSLQFGGVQLKAAITDKKREHWVKTWLRWLFPQYQPVLVSSEQFNDKGGAHRQGKLIFDLANAAGHIVFGPYLWYPPGAYNAVFEIRVASAITDERGRLVIEVVCNCGHRFLAQRVIPDTGKITVKQRTLAFEVDDTVQDVEFRIFVECFTSGSLQFGGVQLKAAITDKKREHWVKTWPRWLFPIHKQI
jgi:lipopolysaccharide biosynthesis glycosyltransferase